MRSGYLCLVHRATRVLTCNRGEKGEKHDVKNPRNAHQTSVLNDIHVVVTGPVVVIWALSVVSALALTCVQWRKSGVFGDGALFATLMREGVAGQFELSRGHFERLP
ncbi:unnamed protein product, partial [Pleuronectes platessa]